MWTPEFYEDPDGRSPVKAWMNKMPESQFAALDAAIRLILCPNGIDLAGTHWLTPLGDGVYEFRVRHSEGQILDLYEAAQVPRPARTPGKILLRLFVMFHGQKVTSNPRVQPRHLLSQPRFRHQLRELTTPVSRQAEGNERSRSGQQMPRRGANPDRGW